MNNHINRTYPHLSGLGGVNDAKKVLSIKTNSMSEAEIIKGNKLIAEFDGWEFKSLDGQISAYYAGRKRWEDSEDFLEQLLIVPTGHAYNTNWNKLMPVIRKTRDYLQNMERPSKNHCCKGDFIEVDLQCRLWEIDIEKTWKHVVELIIWINEYKKSKA